MNIFKKLVDRINDDGKVTIDCFCEGVEGIYETEVFTDAEEADEYIEWRHRQDDMNCFIQ
jgi:hypothetical protein